MVNKKLIYIFLIGIFMVSFASAHWWDPFHWFHDENELTPQNGLSINQYDPEWTVVKSEGLEDELTFWMADSKTKKTELGWIPPNNDCTNWEDKKLYDNEGNPIIDDKDKELTLKCESSKCGGQNCYHVSLTDARAVNIDDYLKIGLNSKTSIYQEQNIINYNLDWAEVNVTLYKNISNNFDNQVNSIWIIDNEGKFGANDSENSNISYYKYTMESSSEIFKKGLSPYIRNPIPRSTTGQNSYSYYIGHLFNFSDICERGDENITADCNFNYYENNSIYYLDVTFYSDMFIDPTITVGSVDISSNSELTNVTAETNYTHSSICDIEQQIGFSLTQRTDCIMDLEDDNSLLHVDGVDDNSNGVFLGTGDLYNFSKTNAVTVSAWIKPDDISGHEHIFARGGFSSASTEILSLHQTGDDILFFISNGTFRLASLQADIIVPEQWYHVSATFNGTTTTLYIGGVQVDQDSSAGFGTIANTAARRETGIGGDFDALRRYWNGSIDKVEIWNASLSSTQITNLFNDGRKATTRRNESFMLGQFLFDDTTKTYAQGLNSTFEEFITGDDTNSTAIGSADWVAQSFTVGVVGPNEAIDLTNVRLKLLKGSGSVGTVTVTIRGMSGGEPNSTIYSSGTFNGQLITESGTGEFIDFDMSAFELQPSTQYSIIIKSIFDDNLFWRVNSTNDYNGATDKRFWSVDSGSSWSENSGEDLMFQIISDDVGVINEGAAYSYDILSSVGYWNFDGEANDTTGFTAYDWSAEENDGTAQNDAVANSTGCVYGNCLQLDGDGDYIDASSFGPTEARTTWSISVWIKPTASAISMSPAGIIGRGASGESVATNLNHYLNLRNGLPEVFYEHGAGVNVVRSATTTLAQDNWYHIVGVRDDVTNNLTIYVNGSLEMGSTSGDLSVSPDSTADDFAIGRPGAFTTSDFNGSIDEVMIFDYALSSSQITAIYNNQSERFIQNGLQKTPASNISQNGSFNRVNLTTTFINEVGSDLDARIGQMNYTGELENLKTYINAEWVNPNNDLIDITNGRNNWDFSGNALVSDSGISGGKGIDLDGTGDNIFLTSGLTDVVFDYSSSKNYTWSGWYNFTDTVLGSTAAIFSFADSGGFAGGLISGSGGPSLIFIGESANVSCAVGGLEKNAYQHIVITYGSGGEVVCYVDGSSLGSGTATLKSITGGTTSFGTNSLATRDFNGSIDNIMIWNKTLNSSEVSDLFDSQVAGNEEPYYTTYQTITDLLTFTISTAAEFLFPDYNFTAGTNLFYSPVIKGDIIFETFIVEEAIQLGLALVDPTPDDLETVTVDNIFANASSSGIENYSVFLDFNNSLVSWWRMDEIDGSGNPTDFLHLNNGTAEGNAAQSDDGYFGKSFEFDGTGDYINLSTYSELNGAEQFTMSLWFNSSADEGRLIGFGSSTERQPWITRSGLNLIVRMRNTTAVDCVGDTTSNNIQNNTWYHTVVTWNSTECTTWINGVLETTDPVSGDVLATSTVDNLIGKLPGISTLEMEGFIDDVMIFNRVLNPDEIRSLHANQSGDKILGVNFTNLADGDYNLTAYAQDTQANLNITDLRTITVDTAGADTSFTVTLPSNTLEAIYLPTTSTDKNVTPENQTDSVPFFNVTNIGNVNLDFNVSINASLPSGISLKGDTDNNPSGAITINTISTSISTALTPTNSFSIWYWSDFTNALEQTVSRQLNLTTSES